ncbi:lipin, N-terminal conserved region-domain-containing protein [Haematococcus lacustris]
MQPASTTSRAANALKTGVVYGGTALLSGVNAITPHLAGAVDIMVVEQPDGSYKSSPFYVRFGKYTHLRSKDRRVNITINGEPAPFHMHLGAYGTAYFTAESTELVDGERPAYAASPNIHLKSTWNCLGAADALRRR